MGQITSDLYPNNVTTYNFTAYDPADGHCEWKKLGEENGLPKETFSMLFGILCAAIGIFGLITSKNVSVGSRYIFALIFGYGIMAALHNATLFNGFQKYLLSESAIHSTTFVRTFSPLYFTLLQSAFSRMYSG